MSTPETNQLAEALAQVERLKAALAVADRRLSEVGWLLKEVTRWRRRALAAERVIHALTPSSNSGAVQ